jgi:hypothetical protein
MLDRTEKIEVAELVPAAVLLERCCEVIPAA